MGYCGGCPDLSEVYSPGGELAGYWCWAIDDRSRDGSMELFDAERDCPCDGELYEGEEGSWAR